MNYLPLVCDECGAPILVYKSIGRKYCEMCKVIVRRRQSIESKNRLDAQKEISV